MLLKFYQTLSEAPNSDLIVIPFFREKGKAVLALTKMAVPQQVKLVLKFGDFKGDLKQLEKVYEKDHARIAMLGLGEKQPLTTESIRKAYAFLTKECIKNKFKKISILIPKLNHFSEEAFAEGISEGVFLANYKHGYGKSSRETTQIEALNIIGLTQKVKKQFKETQNIAGGVYLCRNLVNKNADEVTPQYLGKVARELARKHKKVTAIVFDKKRIEKEKMGLLLAVSRGSEVDPAFIILKYAGADKRKKNIIVVGKGVTYDTGGLNLKPTGSMETMRCDMAGAAIVLGLIEAVASLGLKVNLIGVIPSTENGISASSYKPGDVYTSHSGKTVEIGNTDAEGRLILADAISYSIKKLNPGLIIDFATLTGAMVIALGSVATGMMSNSDELAKGLEVSGLKTYERVWRLPLYEEYREQLKSDIADIKNVGGRGAGSITAALFLQEFVEKTPWAHLDIAGTAFSDKEEGYIPKHATGVGVRLMVDYLKGLQSK